MPFMRLDDGAIGLAADGAPHGRAALYFRPHDIELLEGGGGVVGIAATIRRIAGTKRVELEIGGGEYRVEIEVPAKHPAAKSGRIAFRPTRWQLFSEAGQSAHKAAPVESRSYTEAPPLQAVSPKGGVRKAPSRRARRACPDGSGILEDRRPRPPEAEIPLFCQRRRAGCAIQGPLPCVFITTATPT